MNDMKPFDPTSETLPTKGAKLARVSRLLGWLGLLIAAGTIPLMIFSAALVRNPFSHARNVVSLSNLALALMLGLASLGCAWQARLCFARSQGAGKDNHKSDSGLLGWICLLAVVLNVITIEIVDFRSRPTVAKAACLNYLRQIDGAKEEWALVYKKKQTDTPTWDDLVSTDKNLRMNLKVQPLCPAKGKYTIGNMATKPTCSKAGGLPYHSISD